MTQGMIQIAVWLQEKKDSFARYVKYKTSDQVGATMVEYALIIAVVVVMVIAAATVMEDPLRELFEGIIEKIKGQAGV